MSNPAVVPASAAGSYGICIAFGQNAYNTSQTWTRIDDPTIAAFGYRVASPHHAHSVSSWSTNRGRSYELDKTQTGTASITLQDPTGLFDPSNRLSPFYGLIRPMLQAKISAQNPNTKGYVDIFTGFVESWEYTMDTAEKLMVVTINLVDGFEPLTRGEIAPEANGITTFAGTSDVQSRIDALLDLYGWPNITPTWRKINTGNVFLQTTPYNPQTSYLSAIQDAADAEFPGVANVFMNKGGAVTFYGRYPRFQPTNYPQDVNFWTIGDANAANTFGGARISEIAWSYDQKNIINASLCYPNGILQREIAAQLVTDPASITKFGIRTLSLPDLLVNGQPAGGGISGQPAATANEVCVFYAQYFVDNYATAVPRISRLVFRSQDATDSATWAFMLGVEIGDLLTVNTTDPGGGGFGKETLGNRVDQFFVEGIHNQVNPLHEDYPDWTMTLDVSPRTWFTTDPWGS